jgi:hypothetical protein
LAIANEDQIGVLHNLNEIKFPYKDRSIFFRISFFVGALRIIEFDDIASEK